MNQNETSAAGAGRRGIGIWGIILVAIVSAGVTFALAALLMSIFERKEEAKNPYVRLVEVSETTTDPEVWGTNWQREFDGRCRIERVGIVLTQTEYVRNLLFFNPQGRINKVYLVGFTIGQAFCSSVIHT